MITHAKRKTLYERVTGTTINCQHLHRASDYNDGKKYIFCLDCCMTLRIIKPRTIKVKEG